MRACETVHVEIYGMCGHVERKIPRGCTTRWARAITQESVKNSYHVLTSALKISEHFRDVQGYTITQNGSVVCAFVFKS